MYLIIKIKIMETKLDMSLYMTWDELVEKLNKKIENRWKLLKKQLKEDRKNFTSNFKNLAYV